MAPRKAQTEAKAKGLIGWKNGKKDSSAKGPKVGDYAGKSLNLTKKQLAKGGVKKVSTLKTVNISNTKFVKGKGVVDRTTGKLIRGKMDMGGGNIAVYKNGKRVNITKPKPVRSSGSSSGGSSGGGGKKSGGGDKNKIKRPTKPASGYTPGTSYNRPTAASGTYTASYAKPNSPGITVSSGRGAGVGGGSKPTPGTVTRVTGGSPKVGQIKRTPSGTFKWNGRAWIKQ